MLGFYLADKKGYFKAEGLDVTLRVFSSGAEGAQAFQALGAEMPAILFVNRNAGTTVLVGQVAQSSKGIQLIGPTNIKGPADLKDKKLRPTSARPPSTISQNTSGRTG